MNAPNDPIALERVEEVIALLRSRMPQQQSELLEPFVRRYYEGVDPEDLAERDPLDLYGSVLSHWQFGQKRDPGATRLRVINPTIEEHGWQSTHTVVEIVTDDMPFLVDSVTMEVNRHGRTLHLFIHPIMRVQRNAQGVLTGLAEETGARESFMHVEIDRIVDGAEREALATDLLRVLRDVRVAVEDWKPMTARVSDVIAETEARRPPLPSDELDEGLAFLRWLANNHFTFLGYRMLELASVGGQDALHIVSDSGLGILRDSVAKELTRFSALPPEVRAYARRPELLVVTKSTSRSTVHRPGFLDYIGVKRFDAKGDVCGEHRFFGLFTHTAYSANPSDIPLLRRKVANVIARAGLTQGSHAGKRLLNILETYPRDELFQTDDDELFAIATGILHLGERQRFRLFIRRDRFERFVTCLIYAPRETYNTELRRKWQAILLQAFAGQSSDFNVHLTESVLARIVVTVRTTPGKIPPVDAHELEAQLASAARRWEDDLRDALIGALGEARGNALYAKYGAAFPAGYREEVPARAAVPDIEVMARTSGEAALGLSLYRPPEAGAGSLRFKLFREGSPVTLSDALPMLEHMGLSVLDERPYRITPQGAPVVWLHDYGLQAPAGSEIEIDAVNQIFEDAFSRISSGEVENDDFNRLVVLARLPAEEIVVLRAYAKYMRQIGFPLSLPFVEATLAAHASIARMLVELFKLRFDPSLAESERQKALSKIQEIDDALDRVENLSEDRVLRQYLSLVLATVRTNFWRRDDKGMRRPFLSFKFDPAKIPGLPEPKPLHEIFVYSPRFEGVHLRGGNVARGGLRWSDRPEDFRTEVLGLVKAQMVKNAVIVPVGSKGGFVLKRAPSPGDRDAYLKEGVACYQNYLRGLLDLTDNRVSDRIVPPPQVYRHDTDDPYLVVAADKGTATFSDYANAISKEYGFWLGDAFASGGSAGYDHKAMGITARGAWESAKRHFRELGVDIQTTDFTVLGIGDMSGDVFGNGMLLSRHIKLVAAFDHRHVFIDPDPDPELSFKERERLFKLPRSSWADYDVKLLSPGGGIYPRSAKSIAISPRAKAVLGLESDTYTPTELIHALLRAAVDMIYNGGIGTYVKAKSETHAQVGD
ncbi:MAG TPA: NAD-glutamate dehydrogenase, partial [Casimicrobiaceae bacterium]|nr:NAD-glutamate dehydrogenase [Casimicrobiaceae bacterium]